MSESPRFFDRLSQTWTEGLPERVVLSGQVLVDGIASVDGDPVAGRVLVVDCGDPTVELATTTSIHRLSILQGDDRSSLQACIQVASVVNDWLQGGFDWRQVAEAAAPLIMMSDVEEILVPDPIELEVSRKLPQLRQVFHSPFTSLHYDVERVPVARARRISPRATQALAARTEDWLKVGAAGVTPRRIEALVRDEVIDLYENRVAARLLDEVGRHFDRLLAQYKQLDALVGHKILGSWQQQRRLANLWGSHPPDDGLRALLDQRRHRVLELCRSVAQLRSSGLYEAVPTRARVPQPIRITNLLAEDPNYRCVRNVWTVWWRSRGSQQPPTERRGIRIAESTAFEDVAWLTIAKALGNLESHGGEPAPTSSEADAQAETPWGRLVLHPDGIPGSRAWLLEARSRTGETMAKAHVLPLPCEMLTGTHTDITARLTVVEAALKDRSNADNVIVLYPGTALELENLPPSIQHRAHAIPIGHVAHAPDRHRWVIPISPLDLGSLERVERAVRWLLLGAALRRYPIQAPFPVSARHLLDGASWVIAGDRGDITLVENPSDREWGVLTHRVATEVRQLETQLRGRGAHAALQLTEAVAVVNQRRSELDLLTTCPVCAASGSLRRRSAGTFEVTCQSCEARWGLRHDPRSEARIPYLWIKVDVAEPPPAEDLVEWLGRDVLAEPCRRLGAQYGDDLINPATGACTASAASLASCGWCSPPA